MPKPRYEKTTYDDRARQTVVEETPHIPTPPPSPFCIKESVKEYRDRVRPDWWQKVTEEDDHALKLKRGQSRYSPSADGSDGPSGSKRVKSKTKFQNYEARSCVVRSCNAQSHAGQTYEPRNYRPRRCSPQTSQPQECHSRSWKAQNQGTRGYDTQTCKPRSYEARTSEASKPCAGFFSDGRCQRSCYYRQYSRDEGTCQSFVPLLHTMQVLPTLRAPHLARCR
ncbi:hypothetical protein ISCGN_024726 [Ixodes scapularis]